MTDRNKEIVGKIKEIRMRKSISQSTIATALNITTTAYNRIENNKTQLTVNNLFIIQEALDVTLNELLPLHLSNTLHNRDNIVMSQFNNGTLHITVSASDLEKMSKKG